MGKDACQQDSENINYFPVKSLRNRFDHEFIYTYELKGTELNFVVSRLQHLLAFTQLI